MRIERKDEGEIRYIDLSIVGCSFPFTSHPRTFLTCPFSLFSQISPFEYSLHSLSHLLWFQRFDLPKYLAFSTTALDLHDHNLDLTLSTMNDNILVAILLVVGLLTPVFGWLFYCWFRSHLTDQHHEGQVFHRRARDRTQANWRQVPNNAGSTTLGPHFTERGWVRQKPYGDTRVLPLSQYVHRQLKLCYLQANSLTKISKTECKCPPIVLEPILRRISSPIHCQNDNNGNKGRSKTDRDSRCRIKTTSPITRFGKTNRNRRTRTKRTRTRSRHKIKGQVKVLKDHLEDDLRKIMVMAGQT